MRSIEVVESTGYLAFLEHVKESEECYTHLGQVHSTANGTYTGYIKYYPDDIRNSKGLVNEVCGYLLAKVLGVPVPQYGMILIMERERLVEAHSSLKNILVGTPRCATWVTEQVRGFRISSQDSKALQSLKKWSLLPDLIAFDDWILNTDRSLENLIRERNGHYRGIDHGHIFGGPRWDQHLLDPEYSFRHPLMTELWSGNPPRQVASQILAAAKKHLPEFKKIRPELNALLDNLLESKADKNQLIDFLERRASQSYDRIKSSLGMLL